MICLIPPSPPLLHQTLVNDTGAATQPNCKLSHTARVLLYRYRLIHGATFSVLGSLFFCGKRAARKAFFDIGMFLLMRDPSGGLPNIFDQNLTDAELEQFLLDVIGRQSPGVQRLLGRLRTPQGRQVNHCALLLLLLMLTTCPLFQCCPLSDDTTYIKAFGSADPGWQSNMYSGARGHGHCLLVGHLVDPLGRVIAVRPGVWSSQGTVYTVHSTQYTVYEA